MARLVVFLVAITKGTSGLLGISVQLQQDIDGADQRRGAARPVIMIALFIRVPGVVDEQDSGARPCTNLVSGAYHEPHRLDRVLVRTGHAARERIDDNERRLERDDGLQELSHLGLLI